MSSRYTKFWSYDSSNEHCLQMNLINGKTMIKEFTKETSFTFQNAGVYKKTKHTQNMEINNIIIQSSKWAANLNQLMYTKISSDFRLFTDTKFTLHCISLQNEPLYLK